MILNITKNQKRSKDIRAILTRYGFDQYEMSLAIIDLKTGEPEIFGYRIDDLMYPASMYKVFVGAEMLRQIEMGRHMLSEKISIKSPNDVDTNYKLFPPDTQPLLKQNDQVTIDYLLSLMFSRSDNTAANTLIDLVGRESITENVVHRYGWQGSEVTRKFLDREKEEKSYQFSATTLSCARHMAECIYLIEKGQLISMWVSQKLREYMEHWNRSGRVGLFIPEFISYYRKGGWLLNNIWKHNFLSALWRIVRGKWAVIRWSNDVGVVTGKNSHYAIALFSVTKSFFPWKKFPMAKLSKSVFTYMEGHK